MQLNLNRVGLLLRRMAILHSPKQLRSAGLWFLLLIAASFLGNVDEAEGQFFATWYAVLLYIIGATLTVNSLPELRDADGRQAFLTLPTSDAEKWLATWVYTGPVLVVAFSLIYSVFCLIFNAVLSIWGGSFESFALFGSASAWETIRTYLVFLHPALILGAIVFNRSPAQKTAGTVVIVFLALAAILVLAIRIIHYDQFEGFFTPIGNFNFTLFNDTEPPTAIAWTIGALFSLALLAASYFKFQEKEV